MKENTHLGNVLEIAGAKAKYNRHVKNIIADKTILAWILKYSVRELKELSVEEIIPYIEGKPEIGTVPVNPGLTNGTVITGMPIEDAVQNEGTVAYDIRFYVIIPGGENVKIIVNVEAQKKYHVGYDLVTRGVFYCARMLSAQLDTEFTVAADDPKKYDNIKKVYSIWICMDSPLYAENTITEYHMTQKNVYGNFSKRQKYDLLSVVMICLSKDNNSGEEIHKMLKVLLSSELKKEDKSRILENDYGIQMSKEMESEVSVMCNLADLIEEKGVMKGVESVLSAISNIRNGEITLEEAAIKLNIEPEELKKYL